jgi:hypothetical protein
LRTKIQKAFKRNRLSGIGKTEGKRLRKSSRGINQSVREV